MPETLSTYDAVMKDVYLPGIRDALNNEVTLFNIANAKDEKIGGRRLVFPVKVDRNWGVGSRAEAGTLPTANNEKYVTATVTPKYWYGRVQLTGPLMAQSRGDRNAFADAMTESMDGLVQTSKRYFNRSLYQGQRGDLMRFDQARATASTATFVVTATLATGVDPRGNPARWLAEGMILDGLTFDSAGAANTATSATDFTSATLSSITVSASGTTTLAFASGSGTTATVTIVSGTILVLTGTADQDFLGLNDGIDSSGTYIGVSRAAFRNRGWRSTIKENGGTLRALSLDLLQQAWDGVSEASGEEAMISHLLAHYSVRRQYIQLLQNDVRFQPRELHAGPSGLTFMGADFRFEVDAPYHTIYGINASTWHMAKVTDFEWANDDGSILSRVQNQDAYEAYLRVYGNFYCDSPNRNFRITDVNAAIGIPTSAS